MKQFYPYFFLLIVSFHVNANAFQLPVLGNDKNYGPILKPFKSTSKSVSIVYIENIIEVHKRSCREWVTPIRKGESDSKKIVYWAVIREKVEIKEPQIIKIDPFYNLDIDKIK